MLNLFLKYPKHDTSKDLLSIKIITVINASAAVTLLEQRPEKYFQALSGIRTHDLCDASAVLSQLSYQSHMRAIVYGLALYMGTFRLGPSTVKMKVICPIVAIE